MIYARSGGHHDNVADCFLAAQSLMLAACEAELDTCPIGFARPFFGLPEVKQALEVAAEWQPALPLVVGHPARPTPAPGRRPAMILSATSARMRPASSAEMSVGSQPWLCHGR